MMPRARSKPAHSGLGFASERAALVKLTAIQTPGQFASRLPVVSELKLMHRSNQHASPRCILGRRWNKVRRSEFTDKPRRFRSTDSILTHYARARGTDTVLGSGNFRIDGPRSGRGLQQYSLSRQTDRHGTASMITTAQAATKYIRRGLLPIPIPFRAKAPRIRDWPALRLALTDVARYFNGARSNIGVILGGDNGTADIDLDSSEAVAIAAEFLPDTSMVFGRKSKPASHYFFKCDPPVRTKRFLDPINKGCLVELRCQKVDGCVGLQTMVPPSVHPEGEEVRFEPGRDGCPGNVDSRVLEGSVTKIAAASLLARHWPPEKSGRNAAFLALAGAMARANWPREDAVTFSRAIYRVLWGQSTDSEACRAEVIATYEKHRGGFEITGTRTLVELIDKRVVRSAFSWLGIQQQPARDKDQDAPQKKRAEAEAKSGLPKSICMEDLLADDSIGIPEFMVQGLLPTCGLVLIGGRPKEGKSWFACQLALSVATGEALGGWLKVRKPGRVHLWALEDQYGLTKDKVKKLLGGAAPDALRDLQVFDELVKPILGGGDQIIRAALKEHPAELIILDSLFKLTGAQQQNQDISQRDYDVIDRLRKIAIEHNCVIVIVMHTKKGSRGGNPVENILGTSGTSAAADVIAELKRTSIRDGKLTVVGRLVSHENYELVWQAGPDNWGWIIEGTTEAAMGETQQEVLAYLEAHVPDNPKSIAIALNKSFGSVWMALKRLQERGKVVRGKARKWELVR
jgi:hypothetical protein